ncbi:hypothetical protein M0R45_019435 [Rubus argutus]|uniref:MHC class I antigen n=1 Tax=Rubus argutus TaxID=59490 RepID=A0AAW1X862_RUBAR
MGFTGDLGFWNRCRAEMQGLGFGLGEITGLWIEQSCGLQAEVRQIAAGLCGGKGRRNGGEERLIEVGVRRSDFDNQ